MENILYGHFHSPQPILCCDCWSTEYYYKQHMN